MTEDEKELKRRLNARGELAGSKDMSVVGPEIPLDRLKSKLRQVVIVSVEGFPQLLSFWLYEVTADTVTFYSAELSWAVINFVKPDGTLRDDKGRRIRVFEYLGSV